MLYENEAWQWSENNGGTEVLFYWVSMKFSEKVTAEQESWINES